MNWTLLGRALLTVACCALLGASVLVGYFYFRSEETETKQVQAIAAVEAKVATEDQLDLGLLEFEKVQEAAREGAWDQVRDLCARLLERYPDSARVPDAQRILSQMNLDALLSKDPYPGKEIYTVKSGDSIDAIAQRHDCSYPFVVRVSGLERAPDIHPNDQLVVCPLNFSLHVDLGRSVVEVRELVAEAVEVPEAAAASGSEAKNEKTAPGSGNADAAAGSDDPDAAEADSGSVAAAKPAPRGRFFAAMPILSAKLPQNLPTNGLAVGDIVAIQGEKRLPSFQQAFMLSPKEISLGSGIVLRGLPDSGAPERSGLYLRPSDLEDLALILRRGQKVELVPAAE